MNYKPTLATAVRIRPGFTAHGDDHYVGTVGYTNYIRFGNDTMLPKPNECVFGEDFSQEQIFEGSVRRYIDKFLRGQDVSIMAYGDHNTGKTYTIFGAGLHLTDSEVHYGMLPRAVSYIFSQLEPCKLDCDNVWSPHIRISMYEVFAFGVRDLFDSNGGIGTIPNITLSAKGLVTAITEKKTCHSSMEAMEAVRIGMERRTVHPQTLNHMGTAMVCLELLRPDVKGGEVIGSLQSQMMFVDTATYNVLHPLTKITIRCDVHILELLANSQNNQIQTEETAYFQNCLPYKMLEDFFCGKVETFIICCISPCIHDIQATGLYLSNIWHIYKNKPMKLDNCNIESTSSDELCVSSQTSLSSTLMSEAERLFNRLSLNKSLSEEDRDQMSKWMQLRQQCVDDTAASVQTHPQLERIEEVTETESEEDIASSREKMSEQDSENSSVPESEQEDTDNKVCPLSESDFTEHIEDLYETFYTYVDNQVDTIASQASLSPAREQKPSCAAGRRGRLPDLPITAPQSMWIPTAQPRSVAKQQSSENPLLNVNNNVEVTGNQLQKEASTNHNNSGHDQNRNFHTCDSKPLKNSVSQSRGMEDLILMTTLQNRLHNIFEITKLNDMVFRDKAGKRNVIEILMKISDQLTLLERCANDGSDAESLDNPLISSLQDHRLRNFRSIREKIILSKSSLDAKIKSKIYSGEDLRGYLIADEMIDILDRGNEFLNFIRFKQEVPVQLHEESEMWKTTEDLIHSILTPSEIRHMLAYYFIKVVDLRESTLALESVITTLEQSLLANTSKINALHSTIQSLRSHKARRREVDCFRPVNNTVAVPDDRGACGGTVSNTIPRQNLSKLQVYKHQPPPKVVRSQNNKKLIVELNRDKV